MIDQASRTTTGAIVGVAIACFALGFLLLIGALVRARIASPWLLLAIPAMIAGQGVGKAVGIRGFDLGQLAGVTPLIWLGWGCVTADRPWTRPVPAVEPALG